MKVDRKEAARVAALAHLEFSDEELDRLAAEMTKILSYVDQLAEVDVSAFKEEASREVTPMRDDTPAPSLEREAVERNAPRWDGGFFVVPKVIGGE